MASKNRCPASREDEICISYSGWGYFPLPMEVTFVDSMMKDPVTFEPELVFEGKGAWNTHVLTFSKKQLEGLVATSAVSHNKPVANKKIAIKKL